jgi:para-nitrobenzyl esterase
LFTFTAAGGVIFTPGNLSTGPLLMMAFDLQSTRPSAGQALSAKQPAKDITKMTMTLFTRTALVLASIFAFSLTLAAQAPAPVRTDSGPVQGAAENGLTVYKGIPFAAPPVGDLRWKAPQPAKPWQDVLAADKFAPACVEVHEDPVDIPWLGVIPAPVSEDCLYLNVWTPAKSATDNLAVMVWIYGGGFGTGSTSIELYDGANLANKGVVVVSIAYRVGTFGFLATPELSAEQGGHSGNYGLMDQIAGLQWVQKNIAAFGGDPRRVTIFGESAGGISVSMLGASPLAKGLFTRAISESGGNFAPARAANEGGENMRTLATAEKSGAAFLAKLGASSLADARKLSADAILKAQGGGPGPRDWPIFDGYVLFGDQYELYEAGKYNDTPVLIGSNADEGALFARAAKSDTYQASTQAAYGEYAAKILAAYPGDTDAEALRSSRDLFRDTAFGWPTWAWARLQARTGKSKVYVYYLTHRPPYPEVPRMKDWGASHGGELQYVFGNFSKQMPSTDADRALAEQVESYWTNFAKTGDPNGAGVPAWPAFTETNQQVMDLDDPSHPIPVPNLDQLKVLEGYYAWRRSQAGSGN